LPAVEKALEEFQAPDLNSHSQEFEGRRLQRLEGNDWLILNHEKYRRMQSEEEQREKTRERVTRWRQKQRGANVTPGNESNDKSEVRGQRSEGIQEGVLSDSPSSPDKDPGVDRPETVPIQDIRKVIDAYHKAIAGTRLPEVKSLPDSRKRAIAARIRENGLEAVIAAFEWIPRSALLRGEKGREGWPGATIDWIMGPRNFAKVIEGNYEDHEAIETPEARRKAAIDRMTSGKTGPIDPKLGI
jgi:hypothetical protein